MPGDLRRDRHQLRRQARAGAHYRRAARDGRPRLDSLRQGLAAAPRAPALDGPHPVPSADRRGTRRGRKGAAARSCDVTAEGCGDMAKPGAAFPMLLTQRLRLRRVEPRDADGLHACFGDPEVMQFWDFPPHPTMAETERLLTWLAKTTEAVRAVLGYCVSGLGVHRIQALVHPENRASIRLVERLGFRCEGGPLTDYWCVGNGYRSAMLYAYVASADNSGTEPLAERERPADRIASKRRQTGRAAR